MYRASDRVEQDAWLSEIETAAETLDLGTQARSHAVDLFLSTLPDDDRSKRATMAASVYVGALVAGEERSQSAVADATDVSRLTIQQRWKDLLEYAGLEAPDW
ncbi:MULTISPECIES: transcription initiation factor IIB family protein [Haloarcula]|uniref:Cyclin n=1 Tax=Haloarcula pellucida TaxID=1427151 RepID=A0A830GIW9_9EURY|nr:MULTISPECIES: transcription initiation factor IIB family protein [Halomicroarcula]MBX0347202.1 transcription initiation factor IIB family protein [Halomicroarcula pellucida]MDS0276922.1 transcription initiation factor IIB family protein [Halomicroarcula sp. S1AR25-4]GGN87489.1 cyclin [Halomicroarcula pellucida]